MSSLASFEFVNSEMTEAGSTVGDPSGLEAASVGAPSGVETVALEVETAEVNQAVWRTAAIVEGVLGKSDMIERRMMTGNIELHESVRQLKQLVDTFNQDLSPIDWAAAITVRELNMFELAERKRLSLELLYVDCKTNNQLLMLSKFCSTTVRSGLWFYFCNTNHKFDVQMNNSLLSVSGKL